MPQRSSRLSLLLLFFIATTLGAQDMDPENDSIDGAQDVGLVSGGVVFVEGRLFEDDYDFFSVSMQVGEVLVASTLPLEDITNFDEPDTVLYLVERGARVPLLRSDDDGGEESP